MLKSLIRGSLSLLKWALCGVGVLALLLHALVATPLQRGAGAAIDLAGPSHRRFQQPACRRAVPGPRRHRARLPPLCRERPADGPRGDRGPRLLRLQRRHHPCAVAGAGRARRGNLGGRYPRPRHVRHARRYRLCRPARGRSRRFRRGRCARPSPSAPLTLVGHSSGGGFALRVAGSPIQNLFERSVLLAPYLGYDAPTTRPSSGGWANADIPRIVGLMALRGIGVTCCEALPVLAFAVPPNSEKNLVGDLYRSPDAQLRGQRRFPPRSRRARRGRSRSSPAPTTN